MSGLQGVWWIKMSLLVHASSQRKFSVASATVISSPEQWTKILTTNNSNIKLLAVSCSPHFKHIPQGGYWWHGSHKHKTLCTGMMMVPTWLWELTTWKYDTHATDLSSSREVHQTPIANMSCSSIVVSRSDVATPVSLNTRWAYLTIANCWKISLATRCKVSVGGPWSLLLKTPPSFCSQ
jgi:hypothetical protein